MSINLTAAMSSRKTEHYGNLFKTIDYDNGLLVIGKKSFRLNEQSLKILRNQFQGLLHQCDKTDNMVSVFGTDFNLSKAEIYHIYETIECIISNNKKRAKLGI